MEKNQSTILSNNELRNYVQSCSGIFTPEIVDYLNSLIGLEISALNQSEISESTMAKLNEFSLYRKIVIYNIYNRALNVLNKHRDEYDFEANPQGLSIFNKDRTNIKYDVFNYWFHEDGVSNIVLKQTVIDEAKRREQIDILFQKIKEKSALIKKSSVIRRKFFGDDNAKAIGYISDLIKRLESRSALESNMVYLCESQNNFIDQLLGSDGLQASEGFEQMHDFIQSDRGREIVSYDDYDYEVENGLTRRLVKTYPHTKISKRIRYY